MKFRILPALCSVLALLAAAHAASAEIRIGTAGPLTGQYRDLGEQLVRGARLAVDDINALGGIRGEPLILEVADDECEPRKAVDAARGLIAKGVVFVAGHYCSFASIPAAPVYAQAGVVMISPSATNPKLTDEGGWNVHRIVGRDDTQGSFAGDFLLSRHRNARIGVVDDGSPYGSGLTANLIKTLGNSGVRPAFRDTYKPGQKNFSELVTKMKALPVDVVYAAGSHPELALFVREMRAQGLSAPLVSGDTLVTDEFWTISGEAGEGTLMTFPPDALKFPAAQTVIAKFREADYVPEGATLYAYAAVQAWAEAARAIGSTDSRKIANWLRAGNILHTVVGDLSMNAKGDVNHVRYVWYRWLAGRYVLESDLGNIP